ncbi:hypothetical protein Slip_1799 [Syntrophothermus lipocalidus DSM 12680]|uniref:Uncharacterized protein n=1 Tax=Syntrophothermus lipocalidus (strain DSM 12680 / TGB-C1) TaxID=643648 RepID=D7CPB9_SYNLT|nr:hypothetical protein Slip_1799 [Syntrophothermus lipocalidus DSM 12680]
MDYKVVEVKDRPYVDTRLGRGRLFRILGDRVHVEFDYMYLVELRVSDVDLSGIETEVSNERHLEGTTSDRKSC